VFKQCVVVWFLLDLPVCVYIDSSENLVLWLSVSFMKLYIRVLGYFGRAPDWREIEKIVSSHQDR